MPSKDTPTSVPWSASKPRKKSWSALPPPWCCTASRPGTTRRMSLGEVLGRRSKSRLRMVDEEAALVGPRAATVEEELGPGGAPVAGAGGGAAGRGGLIVVGLVGASRGQGGGDVQDERIRAHPPGAEHGSSGVGG